MQDGGLLNSRHRKEQKVKVQEQVKPIAEDPVMVEVLNVVIQLRVNAENLEGIFHKLQEEPSDE